MKRGYRHILIGLTWAMLLSQVSQATEPRLAEELVVGQSLALTGVLAISGNGLRSGASAYFNALNARGGINGRKILYVVKDDGYKPEETVKNVRSIIAESRPVAMLGVNGTVNAETLIKEKVLEEAKVAMVGPRTGALSLRAYPFMFHVRASYHDEVEKMVQHLVYTGVTHIGIIYQDDAFGQDALHGAQQSLSTRKLESAATATYPRNTTQVEGAVAAMLKAKPQAVLLLTTTAPAAVFIKQFAAGGGSALLIGLSGIDGPEIAKRVGSDAAHGVMLTQTMPNPGRNTLELVTQFQHDFRKFGPKDMEPNNVALEGYLMAKTVAEAIRRAGKTPTRASIIEALESMHPFDTGGFLLSFTKSDHSGSKFVDLAVLDRQGRVLQ